MLGLEGGVDELLEVRRLDEVERVPQCWVEALVEASLLLGINGHFVSSIAR